MELAIKLSYPLIALVLIGCQVTSPKNSESEEPQPNIATVISDCRVVKQCEEDTSSRRRDSLTGLTLECYRLPQAATCAAMIQMAQMLGGLRSDLTDAEIIGSLKDSAKDDPSLDIWEYLEFFPQNFDLDNSE